MTLRQRILEKKAKIAVIGLGYVGMPLAVAFARQAAVIGFDTNADKVKLYQSGIDPTNEVGNEAIRNTDVSFTNNEEDLSDAVFFIVAVPTPITVNKTPDLDPIIRASEIVGRSIKNGSVVVFESTVYPGVTENVCIPIIEKTSGLSCGPDFKVGYSPERINPGDKSHRLENIKKIVSSVDQDSLEMIAEIYELIIDAGVYRAPSIKVAEAAKVAENSQRDINIAFMNELAIVFDRMGIDTRDVIEAMNTKWNALGFYPGLVGGHCIGVDPYYFICEAERLGCHSQIIACGRNINDKMGRYVAEQTIRHLVLANKQVKQSRVAVFGIAYKENCPDTRNSKVPDIIEHLRMHGLDPLVSDPYVSPADVLAKYGLELIPEDEIENLDCLILAVAHDSYRNRDSKQWDKFFAANSTERQIIIDVKGILDKTQFPNDKFLVWRL